MANMYTHMRKAWKSPDVKVLRERMVEWREGASLTKVDKPLRIDRARTLGYKAKKGFVVIRVRVKRGGHKKIRPAKARRSKRMTIRKSLKMSYQWIAEQRAERKFHNLVALNSYKLGKDGIYYFFEVIMIDPAQPEIAKDQKMNWITNKVNHKRAMRGITSAGKKSRGLRNKHPTSKVRPSVRAGGRLGK